MSIQHHIRLGRLFLISALLIVSLPGPGRAEPDYGERAGAWDQPVAGTLPDGALKIGFFRPLTYGLTDRLQIATHPLLDFVIPNVSLQIWHHRGITWDIATRHTLVYPTMLLRMLTRRGEFGIIAKDPTIPQIPQMIALTSEVVASRPVGESGYFTGAAGVTLSVRSGPLDSRTTIDVPLVFPRLRPYYTGAGLTGSVDQGGVFNRWFDYRLEGNLFWFPGSGQNVFVEQRSLLIWKPWDPFRLGFGTLLTFGAYPFGRHWQLLPLLDIQWLLKR